MYLYINLAIDDEKRQREKRKSEKHPSLPEAKKRKSEKHSGLPPENKIEPKIEPDYDQTDEAPRLDRETKDTESEKRRKKDREKRKNEKMEKHEGFFSLDLSINFEWFFAFIFTHRLETSLH